MSVTPLPIYKLPDVAACLRQLADRIERGEEDAVRAVVVMERKEGSVNYAAFGEDFTRAHAIGLCFSAAKEIAP